MKKLLAILLAVLTVAALCVTAVADTAVSASVVTDGSAVTYNPGSTINVVLSLRDIKFGGDDGVSALNIDVIYDTAMVAPVVTAAADSDSDYCDYSSLMSTRPENWIGFGKLDKNAGKYELIFDANGGLALTTDDALVLTIPFTVKSTAKVSDICFKFENVEAYDKSLSDNPYVIDVPDVVVTYEVQPSSTTSLPSDIIPLNVAGYRHDLINVIYYTFFETTVGEYVNKYVNSVNGQDTMGNFAIIIADADGNITAVNTSTGNGNDKSETVIPANHFIIGVHANNTADLDALKNLAKVGNAVKLYNVNVEATGKYDAGIPLTNAGFTILEPTVQPGGGELTLKAGAEAAFSPDGDYLIIYDPTDLAGLKDMFTTDITVLNRKGSVITGGSITTDMTIDSGNGIKIVLVGDVNCDGRVNISDCVLVKRSILNTYTLTGASLKAACITSTGTPRIGDYILIKRIVLKTVDISKVYKNV